MRTLILLAATAGLLAACGQNASDTASADNGDNPVVAAPEGPGNDAIDTTPTTDEAAQAVAANSYTEGQARNAIESAGYTGVSALTKSGTGLWQGTATKDGQTMTVSVDFKGSVTAMTPAASGAAAPAAAPAR